MNVLVLQLKRIGDLVLTTPALAALKAAGHRVTLIADGPCGSLLPAIDVDESLVYSRKGGNGAVWRRLRQRGWDACVDFTGSDRSAFMAWLSRSPRRVTFEWVRKNLLRRLAYHEFVDSPVRLAHTADHYLDLVRSLGRAVSPGDAATLNLPREAREKPAALLAARGIAGGFVLVHPGSARPEKYWLPERWAEVIAWLHARGLPVVVTCGLDAFETKHATEIFSAGMKAYAMSPQGGAFNAANIVHPSSLVELAALVADARIVLSCDTSVVHLAAAFLKPQIALFGPTNPFHWRPRHKDAVVISAAQPGAPLTEFQPKMAGAPMEQIQTAVVLSAAEALLSQPH